MFLPALLQGGTASHMMRPSLLNRTEFSKRWDIHFYWEAEKFIFSFLCGVSHQKLYSSEFTRPTSCGLFHSLHLRLRGGGAYLCGFTPWKRLSSPPSTTEEINTISASYLLWTSHKRCNIKRPRVWVHPINIVYIYLYITSPVGSHSSVSFTDDVWMSAASM